MQTSAPLCLALLEVGPAICVFASLLNALLLLKITEFAQEFMPSPMVISRADGSLNLLDVGVVIRKGMDRASVVALLPQGPERVVEHGNGYSWSSFNGLTFGSMPCGISLCFHHGALISVHLGVVLPDRKFEHEWPTRETSDQEIAFVRKVFHDQLKRRFRNKTEHFPWGVAWSMFDERVFCASSGIRYA